NQSKTYGDTLTFTGSEFSSTGLQNGESIGLVTLTSSGQAATADVAGGPYTITASGATGGTFNIANYSVLYNDGRLTVTPAPIFVSALGGSSVYGSSSTNPGLSATGLKNGQDVSVLTGLSNSFGIDRQTNAGTYTLAVDGTLANPNYSISGTTPGTWTVTPAPITVTANSGTSVYGSVSSDPGLSATGLRNGQDVSVLTGLSNSFGIDPTTNVAGSPYTLSVLGTLTNANYAITTRNTGTWTVTPAPITVTANSGTSVYGSASSDPGLSATGLRNGQDVSVLTGLSNSFGIDPTTNVAGSPYTLSVLGTLTNANYAITTRNTGTWTVTPAPITVTANSGTSVYGSASSDPGLSATGLRNGQDVSVLTGLSNSFGIDPNTNVAGSPYTLSVLGTLTNANYAITTRNTGTWTVTPAPITVTANSGTSVYGSASSDPGLSATGLRNGQDVGVLTGLSNSFGIDPTTDVAGSPYMLSVLGSLTNANYAITTRNTGTWTVTPAPLTITANNQSKTYGDTRAFAGSEFSSTGLKNGESVGLVTLISDGQTAAATVAGGPYPIVVSGATGGTFNITNYNVTYVNGSLAVIPAGIIVTAIGGSSTYGTSPANLGLSATGLRNGEDVSVLSGLSNSFGIDRFSHAGSHPLAVLGTLANPNYVISGREMGIWVVDPAQLTYVANSAKRYYGDSNPPFSGMVTGFVNGETPATATTGTLDFTSLATKDSILGTYAINGSGLNAANYIFVQAPENATALVITAPPTIAASQFGPPVNNPPPTTVNITFESTGSGSEPAWVSFAPRIATSADGDIPTASLPRNADLGSNNGYAFPPISEFDPTQYTQLKLPDYAAQASQATVFTMIARAALSKQAANIMIDTFWNETASDLNGTTGNNPVAGRVTFSDGAGHGVTPGVGNAFTIEPGKTSFIELLRSGPVIIGGMSGHTPAQWLLATGLSPDGKSILCNDPVTGRVVALSLDSATGAIGPIVGFYDLKSKGIAQLADNSGTLPAGSSIEAIKDFVPSTFFAVKIQ
ncbi:MAG: hypothetical protein J0H71_15545, partial [Rhizobiales bacterium]|nr:hypothetical protein [Hyphomicrobiales bacterium]